LINAVIDLNDIFDHQILSDSKGRQSLQSLHRFLCYNVDWVESCLGLSHAMAVADGNIPALIKPWGSEMFPPPSPFEMMSQIGKYPNYQRSRIITDLIK